MNCSDDKATHFAKPILTHEQYSDNSTEASDSTSGNAVDSGYDAFANIFSTNLEDLLELTDDYKRCPETEEMISDAMSLPQEQRDRRLEEIEQHARFLKAQEKRKKILKQKKHRPFDDSNIGLCSVCLDDNFQIIHPHGKDMACGTCFRKAIESESMKF